MFFVFLIYVIVLAISYIYRTPLFHTLGIEYLFCTRASPAHRSHLALGERLVFFSPSFPPGRFPPSMVFLPYNRSLVSHMVFFHGLLNTYAFFREMCVTSWLLGGALGQCTLDTFVDAWENAYTFLYMYKIKLDEHPWIKLIIRYSTIWSILSLTCWPTHSFLQLKFIGLSQTLKNRLSIINTT